MSRKCWYEGERGQVHQAVSQEVERIKRQQAQQRRDLVHFLQLYAAGNVSGLGNSMPIERLEDYFTRANGSTRFNMSAALVDTAVSMYAQNPALPIILTTGADFGLMRKAKQKTRVIQGQFNDLTGDLTQDWAQTAAVTGTGILHDYINDDGLVALDPVHPLEFLVEHSDGLYCKPRSGHRNKLVSKEELGSRFHKHKTAIMDAAGPGSDAVTDFFLERTGNREGFVELRDSYFVSSGPRGKDGKYQRVGRHVMSIEGLDLLDEPWHDNELPFTALRYRKRAFGYFGSGLVESSRENQNRVNRLISRVDRGQDLATNVVIVNPVGAGGKGVKPAQITNEIGLVLEVDSEVAGPPQVVKWDGTQWDLQETIQTELERAMFVEGLSEQQANGEGAGKGMTSGVAVRASDDVQTRRLVAPIKRLQAGCIALAKRICKRNDELAREKPDYEVSSKVQEGRATFLSSSRWAELDIPEGHAQVDMMPMSALPTTPQGKWAAVMEWIEAGFATQQTGMQLLQFPDLDAHADNELAHIDLAQWQVDKLLDGEDLWPVPRQNLQTAIDIVTKSELKALTMNAPPEVIDAFERFLTRAEEMMDAAVMAAQQKQMAAQPPMPAAPPGPPQGAPMPGPGPMPPGAPQGPGAMVQAPPMKPPMQQVVAA